LQILKDGIVLFRSADESNLLIASASVLTNNIMFFMKVIDEPALLVTRFEYANMFHTVTDWYSAYVSSRITGLAGRPHLVFVDGHCKVI
jgi:glycoprotein 2-beta-D-xylosyltransferase